MCDRESDVAVRWTVHGGEGFSEGGYRGDVQSSQRSLIGVEREEMP